jgi:hypothetical protein
MADDDYDDNGYAEYDDAGMMSPDGQRFSDAGVYPGASPVLQAPLFKMAKGIFGTRWTQRWTMLDSAYIMYFNGGGAPDASEEPRKVITLTGSSAVSPVPPEQASKLKRNNLFRVTYVDDKGMDKVLILSAPTAEEAGQWIRAVEQRVQELRDQGGWESGYE